MGMRERELQVAVLGATGYVGGELLRILTSHPRVAELRGYSSSSAGRPWSEAHPSLANLTVEQHFHQQDPAAAGAWADVVVMALPHGRSQVELAAVESGRPTLVVDTAADFRLSDRDLAEAAYGEHHAPGELGSFAFGLADVAATALEGQSRIAVPGCFATAAMLSLWPLRDHLGPDSDPVCWAATGSTGSGAKAKPTTHHPMRAHNFFAYSLSGHRHEAELSQALVSWCGAEAPGCRLLTHSAPVVRGIHATLRARLNQPLTDPLQLLRESYPGSPFVHVLEHPPTLTAVVGTNHAHIHAAARDDGKEIIVTTVIDNLVKGAAGQAVQAMNLALGFDQTSGLGFAGMAPC